MTIMAIVIISENYKILLRRGLEDMLTTKPNAVFTKLLMMIRLTFQNGISTVQLLQKD